MQSLFKAEMHGLAGDAINRFPGRLNSSWCVCIGGTQADNSRLLSSPHYYRAVQGTHPRTNVESIYRRIICLREEMSTEWHFITDRCECFSLPWCYRTSHRVHRTRPAPFLHTECRMKWCYGQVAVGMCVDWISITKWLDLKKNCIITMVIVTV